MRLKMPPCFMTVRTPAEKENSSETQSTPRRMLKTVTASNLRWVALDPLLHSGCWRLGLVASDPVDLRNRAACSWCGGASGSVFLSLHTGGPSPLLTSGRCIRANVRAASLLAVLHLHGGCLHRASCRATDMRRTWQLKVSRMRARTHWELTKTWRPRSIGHGLPIHGLPTSLTDLVINVLVQDLVCAHVWMLVRGLEERVHCAHDLDNLPAPALVVIQTV